MERSSAKHVYFTRYSIAPPPCIFSIKNDLQLIYGTHFIIISYLLIHHPGIGKRHALPVEVQ